MQCIYAMRLLNNRNLWFNKCKSGWCLIFLAYSNFSFKIHLFFLICYYLVLFLGNQKKDNLTYNIQFLSSASKLQLCFTWKIFLFLTKILCCVAGLVGVRHPLIHYYYYFEIITISKRWIQRFWPFLLCSHFIEH